MEKKIQKKIFLGGGGGGGGGVTDKVLIRHSDETKSIIISHRKGTYQPSEYGQEKR